MPDDEEPFDRYSRPPVAKFAAMNVLPVGEIVLAGMNQKTFIPSVAGR
ncbi:MAG: hypothetical protein PHV57_05190 [Methanomicrobiaceae archaeon]|nr:hypothetical protein [Methanomicrobiaceae archaeon]